MASVKVADMPRVTLRIHPTMYERLKWWADHKDMSVNEYIVDAIDGAMRRENGDYDLPTLEQQRLAQLIDAHTALVHEIEALKMVVLKGNDALIGMVRGENYLTDDDDGELGRVGDSPVFGGGSEF